MIPSSFEYTRAETVAQAIELLQSHPDSKILAGGHSLIPAMKLRLSNPATLIDIARIPDLKFIKDRGKYIAIGAATTHHEIATHHTTVEKIGLLALTASYIGDPQVRNRGTLGGSVAHADPASDYPAVLMVMDATIVVDGPKGERNIHAHDFFKGFFTTDLAADEIITKIHVPEPPHDTTKYAYTKFAQPASRFALVGCAVQMQVIGGKCSGVRVAFNGVSDYAFRDGTVEAALEGQLLNTATIESAAAKAAEGVEVMSDHYAGANYRRQMAKVFTKRALMQLL